eukprot:TRINITY_DN4614_c0_g1_i6.p1 TRINITY_DN4614_c0_g1~~TRINITY_DN4614_c0_g1_i6.p1  ORF type:complete len:1833 (+),score=218.19 TRINITY_DN4614_c0_g1_i6:1161-6659(+)
MLDLIPIHEAQHIFTYLPAADVLRLEVVNKRLSYLVSPQHNNNLWKRIFARQWRHSLNDMSNCDDGNVVWRSRVRVRVLLERMDLRYTFMKFARNLDNALAACDYMGHQVDNISNNNSSSNNNNSTSIPYDEGRATRTVALLQNLDDAIEHLRWHQSLSWCISKFFSELIFTPNCITYPDGHTFLEDIKDRFYPVACMSATAPYGVSYHEEIQHTCSSLIVYGCSGDPILLTLHHERDLWVALFVNTTMAGHNSNEKMICFSEERNDIWFAGGRIEINYHLLHDLKISLFGTNAMMVSDELLLCFIHIVFDTRKKFPEQSIWGSRSASFLGQADISMPAPYQEIKHVVAHKIRQERSGEAPTQPERRRTGVMCSMGRAEPLQEATTRSSHDMIQQALIPPRRLLDYTKSVLERRAWTALLFAPISILGITTRVVSATDDDVDHDYLSGVDDASGVINTQVRDVLRGADLVDYRMRMHRAVFFDDNNNNNNNNKNNNNTVNGVVADTSLSKMLSSVGIQEDTIMPECIDPSLIKEDSNNITNIYGEKPQETPLINFLKRIIPLIKFKSTLYFQLVSFAHLYESSLPALGKNQQQQRIDIEYLQKFIKERKIHAVSTSYSSQHHVSFNDVSSFRISTIDASAYFRMNFALLPSSSSGAHVFPKRALILTMNDHTLVEYSSNSNDKSQARRTPKEWLSTTLAHVGGEIRSIMEGQENEKIDDLGAAAAAESTSRHRHMAIPTYEAEPLYFHNLHYECYSTTNYAPPHQHAYEEGDNNNKQQHKKENRYLRLAYAFALMRDALFGDQYAPVSPALCLTLLFTIARCGIEWKAKGDTIILRSFDEVYQEYMHDESSRELVEATRAILAAKASYEGNDYRPLVRDSRLLVANMLNAKANEPLKLPEPSAMLRTILRAFSTPSQEAQAWRESYMIDIKDPNVRIPFKPHEIVRVQNMSNSSRWQETILKRIDRLNGLVQASPSMFAHDILEMLISTDVEKSKQASRALVYDSTNALLFADGGHCYIDFSVWAPQLIGLGSGDEDFFMSHIAFSDLDDGDDDGEETLVFLHKTKRYNTGNDHDEEWLFGRRRDLFQKGISSFDIVRTQQSRRHAIQHHHWNQNNIQSTGIGFLGKLPIILTRGIVYMYINDEWQPIIDASRSQYISSSSSTSRSSPSDKVHIMTLPSSGSSIPTPSYGASSSIATSNDNGNYHNNSNKNDDSRPRSLASSCLRDAILCWGKIYRFRIANEREVIASPVPLLDELGHPFLFSFLEQQERKDCIITWHHNGIQHRPSMKRVFMLIEYRLFEILWENESCDVLRCVEHYLPFMHMYMTNAIDGGSMGIIFSEGRKIDSKVMQIVYRPAEVDKSTWKPQFGQSTYVIIPRLNYCLWYRTNKEEKGWTSASRGWTTLWSEPSQRIILLNSIIPHMINNNNSGGYSKLTAGDDEPQRDHTCTRCRAVVQTGVVYLSSDDASKCNEQPAIASSSPIGSTPASSSLSMSSSLSSAVHMDKHNTSINDLNRKSSLPTTTKPTILCDNCYQYGVQTSPSAHEGVYRRVELFRRELKQKPIVGKTTLRSLPKDVIDTFPIINIQEPDDFLAFQTFQPVDLNQPSPYISKDIEDAIRQKPHQFSITKGWQRSSGGIPLELVMKTEDTGAPAASSASTSTSIITTMEEGHHNHHLHSFESSNAGLAGLIELLAHNRGKAVCMQLKKKRQEHYTSMMYGDEDIMEDENSDDQDETTSKYDDGYAPLIEKVTNAGGGEEQKILCGIFLYFAANRASSGIAVFHDSTTGRPHSRASILLCDIDWIGVVELLQDIDITKRTNLTKRFGQGWALHYAH